jgi:hypothetical protein
VLQIRLILMWLGFGLKLNGESKDWSGSHRSRSRSRTALRLRLDQNDAAPFGSGSATLVILGLYGKNLKENLSFIMKAS